MAKQRHQIALEASAHLLAELVHLAAESLKHHLGLTRGSGMRALDLGAFTHDGVVTDLLLLGLRQRPVATQLLQGQLLFQVDEDAHGAQPARVAALDGHEQLLQRLAGLGLGVLGRQHHRAEGELLDPAERALDGIGQQVAGGSALDHGRGHAVNAAGGAARCVDGGGLDRGQAGVDALDRGVGLVGINGDDEFEVVVSHGAPPGLE